MEMATFEAILGFEMVRRGLVTRDTFRAALALDSTPERDDAKAIHDALAAGDYTIEHLFWLVSGAESGWISARHAEFGLGIDPDGPPP